MRDLARIGHFRRGVPIALSVIVTVVATAFAGNRPAQAATTSCSLATSLAAHELCWLDWTGYTFAAGYTSPFVITLPDGSRLTGTITNTGATTDGTTTTLPTIVRATQQPALGASAAAGEGGYLGVTGKPAFYATGPLAPIQLSNLTFTNAAGTSLGAPSVTIVGADAEDTAAADYDGGVGGIYWTSTGTALSTLQYLTQNGPTASVCTLTGTGTGAAKCLAGQNQSDPGGAYLLESIVTSGQTFTMSTKTTSAEGFAFAVALGQLTVTKNVGSRLGSDQFTVQIKVGTQTSYTASTTGTGTGVQATASGPVVPGAAYTLADTTTAGSNAISQYASTVTCTNATTGSATTLPAAGSATQTVSITPAVDDRITCTFTNNGLQVTNTPANATASDTADAIVTDSFVLKNTSTIPGTIVVATPTLTSSTGSTVTPSGYTFNGNTYGDIGSLNTAIAAAGATAAGGSITVGVTYTTNANTSSSTDTVALPATITSGTGTSAAATGTEVDSIAALPTTTAGTKCYVATGGITHLICWLDFSGYAGVGSETFSLAMPDGSILTGTVNNAGSVMSTPVASPESTKSAFGNTAYTGIQGEPIFMIGATSTYSPIVLSNLKLTDPLGFSVTTVGMVGTDAEVTDTPGFGINEMLNWQTTGAAWTLLQTEMSPNGSNIMCSLSAVPAQNVTCAGVAGAQVDDDMLRTILNTTTSGSPQSFSMAGETSYNQAWAYGINLSLLTTTKTVSSRVSPSDQFTVKVTRGVNGAPTPTPTGTPIASASTAGTGTTASGTTPTYVIPNDTYVLGESMTAGSASALSQYATTYTCTNAMPTAGVTQVLPAANSSGQSVAIVPQPDAEITCAFTNVAVTLTDIAVTPTATYPAGATETDKFTLTNTSSIAGTFNVGSTVVTPFTGATAGTAFAPTGYTLTVGTTTTNYATIALLDAALSSMTPTAAGGSVVVGVTYATTTGATTSDVVSLPATISSGTGTSAVATATETDTLTANAALTIAKTGTTATSPGGLIQYSILVTNNGPSPATGATFSDPLPAGVTVTGTPTCASTSGGAVCGTVTVSGGSPQTIGSVLGSFPSGSSVTFTITASAAAVCGNASSPCAYTNTASISDAGVATTQTSSLTTTVTTASGLSKTVQNVTQGGTAVTANGAKPGDVLQYVLTFNNATGQSIYGLTIADPIPANTTYYTGNTAVTCVVVQSTGTLPPCLAAFGSGSVSGTLPTKASGGNPLTPGGTVTVTFQVKVN